MAGQLHVSSEFLQRALGFGQEGDPLTVGVFPDALPDDFPLTLPELSGLRVLGSVRTAAPYWTFFGSPQERREERRQWRIFLDAGAALGDTMASFQAALLSHGWESGRAFAQTFVEAGQTRWLALNPARGWKLDLALREAAEQSGTTTQVWLTLTEAEAQTIRHLLGQHDPPFDHVHLPMPLLRLPAGWRSQMQQGSGGRVSSEEYALRGPGGASALWPVLLPQLAAQGWALLHHSEDAALFRTPHGSGLLRLSEKGGEVAAAIVQLGAEGNVTL